MKPGLIELLGNDVVIAEVNSAGMYGTEPNENVRVFIGTVGVIRDISARKRMERELKEAYEGLEMMVEERTSELRKSQAKLVETEKIAALGTLAAGVAHELNNPMMGMLNFIQYCLKHTDKNDKRYKILQDAEHETMRCAGIVKDLLISSRMSTGEKVKYKIVSLNSIIDRVLRLLSYRIENGGIIIIKNFARNITRIHVLESNIHQLFLNIIG